MLTHTITKQWEAVVYFFEATHIYTLHKNCYKTCTTDWEPQLLEASTAVHPALELPQGLPHSFGLFSTHV